MSGDSEGGSVSWAGGFVEAFDPVADEGEAFGVDGGAADLRHHDFWGGA